MATRSPFVGREAEREQLDDALRRARLGHGSLVLVSGDAGVGKTHLVESLVADHDHALVLWAHGAQGPATPYGGVVAALRAYLRARPDGPGDSGPLAPHPGLILPAPG